MFLFWRKINSYTHSYEKCNLEKYIGLSFDKPGAPDSQQNYNNKDISLCASIFICPHGSEEPLHAKLQYLQEGYIYICSYEPRSSVLDLY